MIDLSTYVDLSEEFYQPLLPRTHLGVFDLVEVADFMDRRETEQASGWRAPDCYISPQAVVAPDVVVGARAQIHEFATVRSGSIIGDDAVVGFGCEVSRSIVAASSTLTHRVTVCSAIIGRGTHLGAGVVIANTHLFDEDMRRPSRPISIDDSHGVAHMLGVARFGGVLGDSVRVGMGAMLGPGTLVGPRSLIYPGVLLGNGTIGEDKIVKHATRTYTVHELRPTAANGFTHVR
ncbi:hypothetical protein [Streptacidiphilus sp. P02-A3a]|uniref:hypothetical protein n=1 Tax=Streptacidiphilus sp. P02-A3a TaxID=2704468 RepID=UPI0015FCC4F4|nr:hypothetical protein [Streptacidiphilus sp. P02-A3a]QMU67199.1 hypothetical protein GXP74_02220 [Streptacidiphilus sp. P02-A3a]